MDDNRWLCHKCARLVPAGEKCKCQSDADLMKGRAPMIDLTKFEGLAAKLDLIAYRQTDSMGLKTGVTGIFNRNRFDEYTHDPKLIAETYGDNALACAEFFAAAPDLLAELQAEREKNERLEKLLKDTRWFYPYAGARAECSNCGALAKTVGTIYTGTVLVAQCGPDCRLAAALEGRK